MNATAKKNHTGMSDKVSDAILVAILAVCLVIVAYPLYYVLIASVSDPYDVYAGKTFLLPSQFTLDGYKAVFADPDIVSGFLNSVKYTIIGTCFSVIMLYITAYPLAQKDLPGRKFISLFFVFTMYFGGGLIPTYLVVQKTGLIGNMWSLFLPGGVGVGSHTPVHAHSCRAGGVRHGGLLERLVHRYDLPGRQRLPPASGAAGHPDEVQRGGRTDGHAGRRLRRIAETDGAD